MPFPAAVDVGALPDTVGVLKISLDTGGAVADPRMLESMLPRPVESEVAEETGTESVGVGVTRTPLEAAPVSPLEGMILAMIEDRISEAGAVVDAAAEESTPVLGPVMPEVESGRMLLRIEEIKSGVVVIDAAAEESTPVLGPVTPEVESGRMLLRIEEIRSGVGVIDAAAEDSTPVLVPVIPAVDEAAAEESVVVVGLGSRTLLSTLLRSGMRPAAEDEEAAAAVIVAADPEPEIPDVILSEVESGLAVELGFELEEVKTPPGPNVIPLPVEVAAEDGVDSGSLVVAEGVGWIITDGVPPVDAATDESRTLERSDASGSVVLSLELELDVAAGSAPTVVVSGIITVVTPSAVVAAESNEPVEGADPELDPIPTLLVRSLNKSDNDRLVDLE